MKAIYNGKVYWLKFEGGRFNKFSVIFEVFDKTKNGNIIFSSDDKPIKSFRIDRELYLALRDFLNEHIKDKRVYITKK